MSREEAISDGSASRLEGLERLFHASRWKRPSLQRSAVKTSLSLDLRVLVHWPDLQVSLQRLRVWLGMSCSWYLLSASLQPQCAGEGQRGCTYDIIRGASEASRDAGESQPSSSLCPPHKALSQARNVGQSSSASSHFSLKDPRALPGLTHSIFLHDGRGKLKIQEAGFPHNVVFLLNEGAEPTETSRTLTLPPEKLSTHLSIL